MPVNRFKTSFTSSDAGPEIDIFHCIYKQHSSWIFNYWFFSGTKGSKQAHVYGGKIEEETSIYEESCMGDIWTLD